MASIQDKEQLCLSVRMNMIHNREIRHKNYTLHCLIYIYNNMNICRKEITNRKKILNGFLNFFPHSKHIVLLCQIFTWLLLHQFIATMSSKCQPFCTGYYRNKMSKYIEHIVPLLDDKVSAKSLSKEHGSFN